MLIMAAPMITNNQLLTRAVMPSGIADLAANFWAYVSSFSTLRRQSPGARVQRQARPLFFWTLEYGILSRKARKRGSVTCIDGLRRALLVRRFLSMDNVMEDSWNSS